MSRLSTAEINPWVLKRIMAFFNQAKRWEDISQKVLDKPDKGEEGAGYAIGETVAKRIIAHRNQLIPRFFRSFDQVDEVEGLGQDKLEDLAYTFRLTAADEFVYQMFANLIGENWELAHFSRSYGTKEEFDEIVDNPVYLTEEVGDMLTEIAEENFEDPQAATLASLLTKETFLDTYSTTDFAQYAWGLWFYQFDSDNWFSFDRVKEQISQYLDTYFWAADEIQLHLLRGVERQEIWPIAHKVLPITVNRVEKTISIWRAELFD